MRIGEVAERTGLSPRAIRYYEEVGLVVPSARSRGGFRLYTEVDLRRLLLVRQMKPLDLSLHRMRDLLDTLDRIDGAGPAGVHAELTERLAGYLDAVQARCDSLRDQLDAALRFAAELERRLPHHRP